MDQNIDVNNNCLMNIIYLNTTEKKPSGGVKTIYKHSSLINNLKINNISSIQNMESVNKALQIELAELKEGFEKMDNELNSFKKKEKKLMRLIYLVYKKGKDIFLITIIIKKYI